MRIFTALSLGLVVVLSWPTLCYPQEVFEETAGLYSTRRIDASVAVNAQKMVVIQSVSTLRGTINIIADRVDEVSISYFKKAKANTRSKAIDYIDLIAIRLERTAKGIRLQLSAPNPAPWSELEAGLIEANLTVPESCLVEIAAPYFDIDADGPFKRFTVPSSLGELEVSDVSEQLELATANRRVSIERISGTIFVSTSNADLIAKEIFSIKEQARFRNDGGDIRIDGFVGEINVKTSYGRIDILDFEPRGNGNFIRGFSEPIVVDIKRITDEQVVINNRYEDIDITLPSDLSARLSLAVDEKGRIEVSNFVFTTDLVQYDRLNLVAGDGEALISASIRDDGNIFVRAIEEGE